MMGYQYGGGASGYGGALSRFQQQGSPQVPVGISNPNAGRLTNRPPQPGAGYGSGRGGVRGGRGVRTRPGIGGGGGALSQMHRAATAQRGAQQKIGRRTPTTLVPPTRPLIGGGNGNPMLGGRNPMMRQIANRNRPIMDRGRGATSYLR